jgi:putative transposase
METHYVLSEAQWAVLAPLLPGRRGPAGADNRRFVEAVLWLARTGAPWRALPPAWGNWHTTYTRFARWAKSGAWGRLLAAVQARDAGLGTLLLDSTTIRAHQHAAGARKKTTRLAPPSGAVAGA